MEHVIIKELRERALKNEKTINAYNFVGSECGTCFTPYGEGGLIVCACYTNLQAVREAQYVTLVELALMCEMFNAWPVAKEPIDVASIFTLAITPHEERNSICKDLYKTIQLFTY